LFFLHVYLFTRLKELDVILKDREKSIVFNELDFQISNKEIVDAIASTKTGKACGLDSNYMVFGIFGIYFPI
jgi:hypothetical protein